MYCPSSTPGAVMKQPVVRPGLISSHVPHPLSSQKAWRLSRFKSPPPHCRCLEEKSCWTQQVRLQHVCLGAQDACPHRYVLAYHRSPGIRRGLAMLTAARTRASTVPHSCRITSYPSPCCSLSTRKALHRSESICTVTLAHALKTCSLPAAVSSIRRHNW